jgi:hypothetical protein
MQDHRIPTTDGEGPRRVSVLGATGSVGRSTMDLIAAAPERFQVEALTANGNVEALADLVRRACRRRSPPWSAAPWSPSPTRNAWSAPDA